MKRMQAQVCRLLVVPVAVATLWSGLAGAEECDGRYFATDKYGQEYRVKRPTPQLVETMDKAKAGIALEQRNLAVSYDAGYLVSRCRDKAVYWYSKAAESGDETARLWLERNNSLTALRAGPECASESCPGVGAGENRVAVLYASSSKNDHFFAPVTINGRTAQGLIDTGATTVAMSAEMAKTFGISADKGQSGQSSTANGNITTTHVTVPLIDVAGIKLRNVPVSIGISGDILIGMSFLSRVNVAMGSGTLTMTKR